MEDYPKFWKKAIKGSVGGRTLNKKGDIEEFLLKGDISNPNVDEDDLVLEIRDADAEKYFKKSNKKAIKQGYLIEIAEHTLELDETNAVGDGFLRDLLKQNFNQMRKRVEKFTSPVPIYRLLEFAAEENRPVKTIEYIKGAIAKVEGVQSIPSRTSTDSITVTTV